MNQLGLVQTVEAINAEFARRMQEFPKELSNIQDVSAALAGCQQTVGKSFSRLENSGFKLDKGYRATLADTAAEIARVVRSDLGF